MKNEVNWIYYITIVCLMVIICIALGKIKTLQDRIDTLENTTSNIELRLEDITPNDDLP